MVNQGSNAVFTYDEVDNKMFLQPFIATSTILRFGVFDENTTRADVLIGSNEMDLVNIQENLEMTFTSELFDSNLKVAGR